MEPKLGHVKPLYAMLRDAGPRDVRLYYATMLLMLAYLSFPYVTLTYIMLPLW